MIWTAGGRSLAACAIALPIALAVGAPAAHAEDGDTHIYGLGITKTLDCSNGTLHVNGSDNEVFALGSCWAVTVMGSGNTIVADNIVNDVTVYGFNQTVLFKSGDPILWDRGRELGMTNWLGRTPA